MHHRVPLPPDPVRGCTTRIPASDAGAADASHATTTFARNPSPAGDDSSTGSSPVSPYTPMADPDTNTRGAGSSRANARANVCVPSTRLSRI